MRRFFILLPFLTALIIGLWYAFIFDKEPKRLWISADAEAQSLQKAGKLEKALSTYENKLSIASIYFQKGDFKKALDIYELISSKEAFYNRGNTLVMLGKYNDAIENYQLALQADGNYREAKENMAIALARQAELDKFKGSGKGTGGKLAADKIVYDNKSKQGETIQEHGKKKEGSNEQWLDRLETSPQGFLKAKFSYQYSQQKRGQK